MRVPGLFFQLRRAPRAFWPILWAFAAPWLLLESPVVAQDAAKSAPASTKTRSAPDVPRPLVIDLTTYSGSPRLGSIVPFMGQKTPLTPDTYPVVSGAQPDLVRIYHWLLLDENRTCPAPTPSLKERLKQVDQHLVDLEMEKALASVQLAWEELPCQHEVLTRESLRRLFYLEGVAWYYAGDKAETRRAFLEAMAIEPSLMPLAGYAPEINDAYLDAARGLPALTPMKMKTEAALRQPDIRIDGEEVREEQLLLRPGRHVAQRINSDGIARTVTFDIVEDDSRTLARMIQFNPPDTANYQRDLLRVGVQGDRLSTQQARALSAYAQLFNHPYLFFVLPSTDGSGGGLRLSVFIPGTGLSDQVPPDVKPLPPMPSQASRVVGPRKPAEGTGQPAPSTSSPPGKTPRPSMFGEEDARWEMQLAIGPRGYNERTFLTVEPTFSYQLRPSWAGEVTLRGAFTGKTPQNPNAGMNMLWGIRPGIGLQQEKDMLHLRARAGLSFSLTDVVTSEQGTQLVLQAMPEVEGAALYSLTPELRAGFQLGTGFAPGFGTGAPLWTWHLGLVAGGAF